MTPTPDDWAELRRLAGEATPGPLVNCDWDPMERPHVYAADRLKEHNAHPPLDFPYTRADAAYIVALVNAAPRLLDRLDDLIKGLTVIASDARGEPDAIVVHRRNIARALLASTVPAGGEVEG